MLDINKNLYSLQGHPNLKGNIDYSNMNVFDKLGSAMPDREGIPDLEVWPIFFAVSCALFVLACSVTFHWFGCMNKKTFIILDRMDISGILIGIYGLTTTTIYYS